MWSPKECHCCGSVGSVRGTLVLIFFVSQFQGWDGFQISEVSAGFGFCV